MADQRKSSIDPRDVVSLMDKTERETLLGEEGCDLKTLLRTHDAQSLLLWLNRNRTPFIKMAATFCGLLSELEASVRGNINFIILPGRWGELALDFGPQLRRAVATAIRHSDNSQSAILIGRLLQELEKTVKALCSALRPKGTERLITFTETYYWSDEYNPLEAQDITSLSKATRTLLNLAERLYFKSPPDPKRESAISSFRQIAKMMAKKALEAQEHSWEFPQAPRCLPKSSFTSCKRQVAELEKAILVASDFQETTAEMFDFHSLDFWKQRWRVYELWLLARVVNRLKECGACITQTSRIANGRWSLKFTRDSLAVLGLTLGGNEIELYYQYFEAHGSRGNMPDIALKIREREFVIVFDPKHGNSYSRKALNRVCLRYAKAFAPSNSCVMNYFPRENPVERLSEDPSCMVLYGLQPDSEIEKIFDMEVVAALRESWQRLRLSSTSLIILFDISCSTTAVRCELRSLAHGALTRSPFSISESSKVMLFAEKVVAVGGVRDFLNGTLESAASGEGTDLMQAFNVAFDLLATLPGHRELWIFTDGEGELDSKIIGERIQRTGTVLRVWEATHKNYGSVLSSLTNDFKGHYHRIP
jgi:hypothetical protein